MELIYDLQMTSLAIVAGIFILEVFDKMGINSSSDKKVEAVATTLAVYVGFLSTMYFIWMT